MALSDRFRKLVDGVTERAASALRERGYGTVAQAGGPRELTLQASIPNPFSDVPLCRLSVQISTDEHSQGASLRLRAHLQTQLVVPPARQALPAPAQTHETANRALMPRTRRAARGLVQRGLQLPIAQKVTPYLERRFESWIDVQASTRPLDRGAQDLLPEPVRTLGFGQRTMVHGQEGAPQIETWAGRCEGERSGIAQVTVLQFNEAAKPAARRRSKRPPLHLAASVATFYEDELPG